MGPLAITITTTITNTSITTTAAATDQGTYQRHEKKKTTAYHGRTVGCTASASCCKAEQRHRKTGSS
jgi:hypothetical protein